VNIVDTFLHIETNNRLCLNLTVYDHRLHRELPIDCCAIASGRNKKEFVHLELLANQMNVLVDLLSTIPKSIIQNEMISVGEFQNFERLFVFDR
jgi:hypothetical protein